MKTVVMKLSELRPAGYNPRVTLKPGDSEWEDLKKSVDRFGLVEPLVWNEKTGNLLSGHQRYNILKSEGQEEAEVVVVSIDEDKEKLANVAINKIDGDWDYMKLKELFDEMDEEDIEFTGFKEDELINLFGDTEVDFGDEQEEKPEKTEKEKDKEEKPDVLSEFNVFLSFPTKELAEEWMKERGIEAAYEGTARNITIRMEGTDYGTGN